MAYQFNRHDERILFLKLEIVVSVNIFEFVIALTPPLSRTRRTLYIGGVSSVNYTVVTVVSRGWNWEAGWVQRRGMRGMRTLCGKLAV